MDHPTRKGDAELRVFREHARALRQLAKEHGDRGNDGVAAKYAQIAAAVEAMVSQLEAMVAQLELLLQPAASSWH